MIGDVKNVYDSIDIIVYWSLTLEAVKPTNWLLHGCILACSFNNNTSILANNLYCSHIYMFPFKYVQRYLNIQA